MILKFLQLLLIGSSLLFSMPTFAAQMGSDYREVYKEDKSILWQKMPKLIYSNSDLGYQNRHFNCLIYANQDGDITHVEILKSTGIDQLDQKIVTALYKAKFINPNREDIMVQQPFELTLNQQKGLFEALFELLFKK